METWAEVALSSADPAPRAMDSDHPVKEENLLPSGVQEECSGTRLPAHCSQGFVNICVPPASTRYSPLMEGTVVFSLAIALVTDFTATNWRLQMMAMATGKEQAWVWTQSRIPYYLAYDEKLTLFPMWL